MTATTERRTKRLADLVAGDVIVIDRGGHTAVVESHQPDAQPTLRARGYYQTRFVMDGGRPGGWTGHGESQIEIVAAARGGAA
jgi:hypothetical protein